MLNPQHSFCRERNKNPGIKNNLMAELLPIISELKREVKEIEDFDVVIHYDPVSERFYESLKRLVASDKFVIIRLYPRNIPREFSESHIGALDRDGEPYIVIGYDDQGFIVYDIFNKQTLKINMNELTYAIVDYSKDLVIG